MTITIPGQVIIEEKIELNPIQQIESGKQTREGDGWWIGECYINWYDSTELDFSFVPSSIEPGETQILRLWAVGYPYDEECEHFLERNITLEPNLGTLTRIGNGEYKYYAPSSTPGDTTLVVTANYEQFCWDCAAFDNGIKDSNVSNNILECGCLDWQWTVVSRVYGTASIIIAWDSLDVKVIPDTIYAGDTAQVVIKKRLPDGTLVDFDSTQTYEAGMLEGCILGKLVAGTQEGPYVVDVLQPIYFVADTSADSTGTVLLRVGLVEQVDKPQNKNNLQTDIVESDCFVGWQSNSYDDVTVFKDNPLEIIYPTSNDPHEKITSDPQMPEVICKAWLKNNIGEPVTFEWEYEVSYTYERWNYKKGRKIDLCSRSSKSTFRGTTYGSGGFAEEWVVPFTTDMNNSFEFKGRNWDGGCEEIITQWTEGYEVFTGGNVKLTVVAKATGSELILGTKTLEANKILGDNPSLGVIYNYANSNKVRAIMEEETKEVHFTSDSIDPYYWRPYNEKGWPIYGYPNGYGLMQIDNMPVPPYLATEKIMWNWKSNIDAGKIRISLAESESDYYISRRQATSDEKYRLTNAFQNYRWGGYDEFPYIWVNGKWREVENIDSYGKNVYNRYILLGGGN